MSSTAVAQLQRAIQRINELVIIVREQKMQIIALKQQMRDVRSR